MSTGPERFSRCLFKQTLRHPPEQVSIPCLWMAWILDELCGSNTKTSKMWEDPLLRFHNHDNNQQEKEPVTQETDIPVWGSGFCVCVCVSPCVIKLRPFTTAATVNLSHICPHNPTNAPRRSRFPFLHQASHWRIASVSEDIWFLSGRFGLLLRRLCSPSCVFEPAHANKHVTVAFTTLHSNDVRQHQSGSAHTCGATPALKRYV